MVVERWQLFLDCEDHHGGRACPQGAHPRRCAGRPVWSAGDGSVYDHTEYERGCPRQLVECSQTRRRRSVEGLETRLATTQSGRSEVRS